MNYSITVALLEDLVRHVTHQVNISSSLGKCYHDIGNAGAEEVHLTVCSNVVMLYFMDNNINVEKIFTNYNLYVYKLHLLPMYLQNVHILIKKI